MISEQKLVDFKLSTGSYKNMVDRIIRLASTNRSAYISVANVHMFVTAHNDEHFKNVVNNSTMVTPDGKPLAWALRLFDNIKQERVAGMDLFPSLLEASAKAGISVYFYGSTPDVILAVEKRTEKILPTLKIAGWHCPPFRKLSDDENTEVIRQINEARPNLVFVALGCPKQEKWMHDMKGKVSATMIGVGGALPVFAGIQKRAPLWMQKNGLEWFYRFLQEPRRLFKRYAVTNTKFALIIGRAFISQKLLPTKHKSKARNPIL